MCIIEMSSNSHKNRLTGDDGFSQSWISQPICALCQHCGREQTAPQNGSWRCGFTEQSGHSMKMSFRGCHDGFCPEDQV